MADPGGGRRPRRVSPDPEARAAAAEIEAQALRLQRDILRGRLVDTEQEIERLRRLVDALLVKQADLEDQLRQAQTAGRQVSPAALAAALANAVDRGAAALEGRTIVAGRAEIRASLQVEQGEAGLVLADPRGVEAASLSTISFDLRPVPPTPTEEARRIGVQRVLDALLRLQSALDREVPRAGRETAATALAETSALAAAPPDSTAVGPQLAGLTAVLRRLATWLPELAGPAADLEARRTALSPQPSGGELAELAAALEAAAVAAAGQSR